MTVRVWLARHGATEWSASGRLTGWRDVPLSDAGREQAVDLRRRLDGRGFDSVRTSDLVRAVDTARIVAGAAVPDPRLRELDFGTLEGATWEELAPGVRRALMRFDGFEAPEGESVRDLRRRLVEAIAELPAGDHLIVTHGGVIRALVRNAGLVGPGEVRTLRLRESGLTRRRARPGSDRRRVPLPGS